jgi:hypothetical protein
LVSDANNRNTEVSAKHGRVAVCYTGHFRSFLYINGNFMERSTSSEANGGPAILKILTSYGIQKFIKILSASGYSIQAFIYCFFTVRFNIILSL